MSNNLENGEKIEIIKKKEHLNMEALDTIRALTAVTTIL